MRFKKSAIVLKCEKVLKTIQLYIKNLKSCKYMKKLKIVRHQFLSRTSKPRDTATHYTFPVP